MENENLGSKTEGEFAALAGSAFRREYLGVPPQETDDERKLRELAEEYHRRTEAYDRTICTGPIKRGAIMPATAWEGSQINRHAKAVRDELEVEAVKLGFTPQQWRDAIRRAANTPNAPAVATAPEDSDQN